MTSQFTHLSPATRRRLVEDRLPSLFDPPPPPQVNVPSPSRANDPETSKAAAIKSPVRRGSERYRLLEVFVDGSRGLTDDEASRFAGVDYYEGRRRCVDLRRYGLIEPTGEKRQSTFGNLAMVCRVTPDGIAALRQARQVTSA